MIEKLLPFKINEWMSFTDPVSVESDSLIQISLKSAIGKKIFNFLATGIEPVSVEQKKLCYHYTMPDKNLGKMN